MKISKWILAAVALYCAQSGLADPLHEVGQEGAWQHEQSGWVFPKHIGAFTRGLPPYEIDGTYDVGAEYEMLVGGTRTAATVHIYAKDSASIDATLEGAKAATANSLGRAGLPSEASFSLDTMPHASAVKITYPPEAANLAHAYLFFVETVQWIVTIRGSSDANAHSSASLDRFVNALRWETLGSDPGVICIGPDRDPGC